MEATASLKPPLVSEDPATRLTFSSSIGFPTTSSAIPSMNSPWYRSVYGAFGSPVTSTSVTTPSARVSVTVISSTVSGVWYEPSAV